MSRTSYHHEQHSTSICKIIGVRSRSVPGFTRVRSSLAFLNAGTIDWGHLNAEKVNLDPQSSGYEILGAEAEDIRNEQPAVQPGLLPPPPTQGLKKQQKLQQKGMSPAFDLSIAGIFSAILTSTGESCCKFLVFSPS